MEVFFEVLKLKIDAFFVVVFLRGGGLTKYEKRLKS